MGALHQGCYGDFVGSEDYVGGDQLGRVNASVSLWFLNCPGGLKRFGIRAALAPAIAIFFDDRERTKPLHIPLTTTRINFLHNPSPVTKFGSHS